MISKKPFDESGLYEALFCQEEKALYYLFIDACLCPQIRVYLEGFEIPYSLVTGRPEFEEVSPVLFEFNDYKKALNFIINITEWNGVLIIKSLKSEGHLLRLFRNHEIVKDGNDEYYRRFFDQQYISGWLEELTSEESVIDAVIYKHPKTLMNDEISEKLCIIEKGGINES